MEALENNFHTMKKWGSFFEEPWDMRTNLMHIEVKSKIANCNNVRSNLYLACYWKKWVLKLKHFHIWSIKKNRSHYITLTWRWIQSFLYWKIVRKWREKCGAKVIKGFFFQKDCYIAIHHWCDWVGRPPCILNPK
jgi:hypothetical protein